MITRNVVFIALLGCLAAFRPAAAMVLQIQTGTPALIVTADCIDRFRRPLPVGGGASRAYLSADGYRFALDRLGRRLYDGPLPHALGQGDGTLLPVGCVAVPTTVPVALSSLTLFVFPAGTPSGSGQTAP